jgi:capsular polysaccharide biosynthesis protein
MELREYWTIIRRRWWLPIVLALLTGVVSALQLRPWAPPPATYSAGLRFLVGVLPAAEQDVTAYDPRYYGWLTSEYLVDDFTEVVRSGLFANNVSARLAASGIAVPAGVIQGSAATGKQHRIIALTMSWGDRAQLEQIIAAAAAELTDSATSYFDQWGTGNAGITLLDGPAISENGPGVRERLELPLRVLLAALAGLGLIFLLHYFDQTIRTPADLAALGLQPLASIPPAGRRRQPEGAKK